MINKYMKNCNLYTKNNKLEEIDKKEQYDILLKAIVKKEFKMYYQPQFNIKSNEIIGFEALLRWENEKYINVSPLEIITTIEELKLTTELNKYVFNQVFEDYCYLNSENSKIGVSINVSFIDVIDEQFIKFVTDLSKKYKTECNRITLEITERAKISNVELFNNQINQLRDLGFRVSLDDFGTGYNGMSVFLKTDFDEIKIDRTYIDNIKTEKGKIVISKIIDLAKTFGMRVVAEGVECFEQRDLLVESNCMIHQGYLYSLPVKLDEAIKLLK